MESRRLETCGSKDSRSKSEVKCIRRPSTTKKEREGERGEIVRERERRREGEGEEEREKEKRRGGILSRAEFERRFTEEGRSVSNEIFSRLRDRIFNQFRESDERSSEATQLIPGFSSRPLVLESLTRFRAKNVWRAKDRFGFLA